MSRSGKNRGKACISREDRSHPGWRISGGGIETGSELFVVQTLLRTGRCNNGLKRVHAPLRAETLHQTRDVLVIGDLRIDVDRHEVTCSGQQLISGGGYPFDLLLYLVRHRWMVRALPDLCKV